MRVDFLCAFAALLFLSLRVPAYAQDYGTITTTGFGLGLSMKEVSEAAPNGEFGTTNEGEAAYAYTANLTFGLNEPRTRKFNFNHIFGKNNRVISSNIWRNTGEICNSDDEKDIEELKDGLYVAWGAPEKGPIRVELEKNSKFQFSYDPFEVRMLFTHGAHGVIFIYEHWPAWLIEENEDSSNCHIRLHYLSADRARQSFD